MSEIRRYDWNTGEESPTGEHVHYSAHLEEVQRLRAMVAALEAENGRLKAPVSDEEWEQFAYEVRIATPTNFVHMKMMEFSQLNNLIASRVMNATIAAQQPSPAQKEQP